MKADSVHVLESKNPESRTEEKGHGDFQDTTGVYVRGMYSKGWLGNLGEPLLSLSKETGTGTGIEIFQFL